MFALARPLSSLLLLVASVASAAAVASATAAFEPAQIAALTDADTGTTVFEINGIWPDTCPPRLEGIGLRGHDITLHAARETTGCQASPTPYALRSAPLPPPPPGTPPGIRRVHLMVTGLTTDNEPALAGFALVQTDPSPPTMALETGFWWAPQEGAEFNGNPGLGLSLETQGELLSLSVLGYDAQGRSAWYFGAGLLQAGIARLDLGRFEGGSGPFERLEAPQAIHFSGHVDIEAQTPSRAVLWFSRADPASGRIELQPVSIVRFSFEQSAASALLGRWLLSGDQAETRAPRWIEWTQTETVADGFVLSDATGGARLHCFQPLTRATSAPPRLCRLALAQDDVLELTDIALRRLSGWDAHGHRVLAFRLN